MQLKKNVVFLKGVKLTYYSVGSGKPILFLHGGRVRALTFRKNLELLAKKFLVIAPDIPGYGNSTTPRELWNFKDYARFFDLFLKRLNLDNVSIVGYSLGGGIALYMSELEKVVAKIVVIDSAGVVKEKRNLFVSDVKRFIFYLVNPLYIPVFILLLKEYLFYLYRHIFDMRQMLRIRKYSGMIGYVPKNISKRPMLILWAERDWIFSVSYGRLLQKNIPHAKLGIVPGNHDWILYNPRLFIQKITPFLVA